MSEEVFRTHYPDYNVLAKWSSLIGRQTREVVRQRLEQIPQIRFFTREIVKLKNAVSVRNHVAGLQSAPVTLLAYGNFESRA